MRVNVLLLSCALLFGASGCASSGVTNIVLSNGEYPPYTSQSLPHGGSVSRIVREAFALEGITVHYEYLSWQRGYEDAKNGELDGTIVWSRTPARELAFYFSDPVVLGNDVIFYPKAAHIQWNQLSDLSHLEIGATIDYNYGPEFDRLEKAGILHVTRLPSDTENLMRLANGQIQAFPIDLEVGLFLVNKIADVRDKVDYNPKSILSIPLHLLVSKKSSQDGEEILKKFNDGLAQLRSSGKIEQYLVEGRTEH